MKSILLFTSAPLIAVLTATPTAVPHEAGRAPSFGVYEPAMHCPRETQLSFNHVFVSWASYRPGDLLRQLHAIQANGQRPFVTLEPWPYQTITPAPPALLVVHRRPDNLKTFPLQFRFGSFQTHG